MSAGDKYLQDNADHWRAFDEHDDTLEQRRHAPAPIRGVMKRGRDLQVGDTIVFLGTEHRITAFSAYEGPLLDDGTLPADTRIAYGTNDWGMTIVPDGFIEVVR